MPNPLCIDLFCGLGGWADGFLAEGYDVVGFDNERHVYGSGDNIQKYPAQLVLQDVLTLHGSQFRNAAVIVASPPCQEYSYMAMPWKLAKAKAAWYREVPTRQLELTCLFNACFRIAHQARVPLIVENVKGTQPWVGRARAHFGSFYLWGDVDMIGGRICAPSIRFGQSLRVPKRGATKNDGGSWFAVANNTTSGHSQNPDGRKVAMNFHEHEKTGKPGRSFQSAAVGDTFGWPRESPLRDCNSKSPRRKAASAQIAKIPFPLAQWIAKVYKP